MIELAFWIAVFLFVVWIASAALWGLLRGVALWFEPSCNFEEDRRRADEQADRWVEERRKLGLLK